MTFYNKNTGEFGALGHGIIDKDTESLIEINSGEITTAKVLNINKAVSGNPGEIRGGIGDTVLGEINNNTRRNKMNYIYLIGIIVLYHKMPIQSIHIFCKNCLRQTSMICKFPGSTLA